VEGYSSRLEQVEDRISEVEEKLELKEKKNRRNLGQQFKSCERNMKEISEYIKIPNLRIMGIEEGEEVQGKGYIIYLIKS
jgi:hypothetical protein